MKKLNFNLNDNVVERLDRLVDSFGMNRTAVISMLINNAYKEDPLVKKETDENE